MEGKRDGDGQNASVKMSCREKDVGSEKAGRLR